MKFKKTKVKGYKYHKIVLTHSCKEGRFEYKVFGCGGYGSLIFSLRQGKMLWPKLITEAGPHSDKIEEVDDQIEECRRYIKLLTAFKKTCKEYKTEINELIKEEE